MFFSGLGKFVLKGSLYCEEWQSTFIGDVLI